MGAMRDWSPFLVCPDSERAPCARSLQTPEGLGDRLRTAAFAELQAREAFLWAAGRFEDAPAALREAWRALSAEEGKHLGWLLARMEELGLRPDERPVSARLWSLLSACATPAEFSAKMKTAEERGRSAERSFQASLAQSDPVTAEIFGRIADEEDAHIALAERSLPSV